MLFDTRDRVSWWLQVIAVALSIVIVLTGGLLLGWHSFFGQMTDGDGYDRNQGVDIDSSTIIDGGNTNPTIPVEEEETPNINFTPDPNQTQAPIIRPSVLNNLKSNIKNWMNNGEPVRDGNVINILLIGMDNTNLAHNSRADAMCILSINKLTKTINLVSLLRDQYSYIILNNKGSYQKLHHQLYSGPEKLIQMIERYYKVVIDNYALVNFASIPKVIDAIGGITVTLTPAEAYYLKNTCKWNVNPKGDTVHINGAHAVTYMRIRKGGTGDDNGRVERQRKVLMMILNRAKDYDMGKMISVVNTMIPYVRTGLTSTDILGYATTALAEGWLKYEIKQLTLPDSKCAKGFTNPEDGYWYWKVDFPVAAQKLQKALYGKSNIQLASNRTPWI